MSRTSYFHSQVAEQITRFSDPMRLPGAAALAAADPRRLAILDGLVTEQAATMAYANDLVLMTAFSLIRLSRPAP